VSAIATAATLLAGAARADDAAAIVKAMSDYISSQKTLSVTFDTDVEIITPEVQKIQFTSSGSIDLNRPGQFRVKRTGGYADVELIHDGKILTLLGKDRNIYAQAPADGTNDDVVAVLRDQYGASLPAADLLSSDPYGALMAGVTDAKHIGLGVINNVECEHLAFRTLDTDWQLWVEVGAKPIPCRMVITSKAVAAAPQYTVTIHSWKDDATFAADAFDFVPPAGAKKIDVTALTDFDEVPPGQFVGEGQ
jgi:hypothetical protein